METKTKIIVQGLTASKRQRFSQTQPYVAINQHTMLPYLLSANFFSQNGFKILFKILENISEILCLYREHTIQKLYIIANKCSTIKIIFTVLEVNNICTV